MATKIPATVITGFLGAGKTSLIRHLLQHSQGRRLALIINEFGDLGVDRELLAGCGVADCRDEDIVELANGCLCCTVADDFLPTLEKLINRADPPEHILIETSGLALPKPLVKAFNWPEIRTRVTVDGVVAVIDAEAVAAGRFADPSLDHDNPLHDNPLEELFEDQILCADLIVLNKTDRVDADALAVVAAAVDRHRRPSVKTVRAVQGAVDPRVLLGLEAAAEDDLDGRRSHHDAEDGAHDHDDFDSFIVRLGAVADPDAVEVRVRAAVAAHDILRIKGFLDVNGKALRHVVQGVGDRIQRYYDRPWRGDEPRHSALVVIGQRGIDRAAIEALLVG